MRVCMFVYNNCTNDARVLKEARTLLAAGHDVTVVAVLDVTTTLEEDRDGLRIVRIDRRPLHYRLLWWYRARVRSARLARARLKRFGRRSARRLVRLARRSRRRLKHALRRARRLITRLVRRARVRLLRGARRARRRLRLLRFRLAARLGGRPVSARSPRIRSPRRPRRYRLSSILRRRRAGRRSGDGEAPAPAGSGRALLVARVARVLRLALTVLGAPLSLLAWLLVSAGRGVSRFNHRTLMRMHKPLMFGDWYWRAYRLLRDERFDVLHAHDLNTLPVAAALKRRTGALLVYDAHELYPDVSTLSTTERRVWKVLERRLIGRADEVITVCDSIGAELQRRYPIAPPTILLNCPPSADRVELSSRLLRAHAGLDDAEPLVLYQGGFTPNRGLAQLVRAAGQLERGRLIMMGWGRLEDELRAIVRDEGLGSRVVFTAPVAQDVLLSYTAGADVGVIPYEPVGLNNLYSTPNKLFEYLSVGLPIVGSNLPELAKIVLGCEVGLTFERAEPELIAAALNRVLLDDDLRAGMRRNALSVRARYTWETQAGTLLRVYARVEPARPVLTRAA